MKIIITDGSKDYYDGFTNAQDDLTYVREYSSTINKGESEIGYELNKLMVQSRFGVASQAQMMFSRKQISYGKCTDYRSYITTHFMLLIFCGKIYPIFTLLDHKALDLPREIYHTQDQVKLRVHQFDTSYYSFMEVDNIKAFLENAIKSKYLLNLNIKMDCPIILISGNNNEVPFEGQVYDPMDKSFVKYPIFVSKNVNLKDLQFSKLLNNYQCFQEIEMFMGTVLVKDQMTMKPITDKLKATTHGFNDKSFRKEKQERKTK